MLTRLKVRNFKRFDELDIELDSPVVFIGPNNSGKTTAMQALALWHVGLQRWTERYADRATPTQRPGVTVNRRDLLALPVPTAKALWRGLHVRDVHKTDGKQRTSNVRIDITVSGETHGHEWEAGFEFDYANEESFYCRPLRLDDTTSPARMEVPDAVKDVAIAFLPPMSGMAANETRLDPGAIGVRIGEGRTAEVLRNLCFQIHSRDLGLWGELTHRIHSMFGADIQPPEYVRERGEITMNYIEDEISLDLSAAGRGLQQTLLLLAYMYANPGATLLLDEPDAHLEILRQRQIYHELTKAAASYGSQVIAATHSEVVLNEAARRDTVVAFVGKPHTVSGSKSQVAAALKSIGFEHYAQAEQTGWVLYLEGSTDLLVLQRFAERLQHKGAMAALERPFVEYVANDPGAMQKHFYALREAFPSLRGVALFDRLERGLPPETGIDVAMWRRREIENYLCTRSTLASYAARRALEASNDPAPMFSDAPKPERWIEAMQEAVEEVESARAILNINETLWSRDAKASDDILVNIFAAYAKRLNIYNEMPKNKLFRLVEFIPDEDLDPEVEEKLDKIALAFDPSFTQG